jgi:type IV pilus assembly protein PilV
MKTSDSHRQSGVALLEALISVLIFSLAIIGLISMQSLVIKNNTENRYRADATTVAQRVLNDLQLNPTNLAGQEGTYNAGNPGNTTPAWGTIADNVLPGGQVQVDVDNTDTKLVTIIVSWAPRQESAALLTANYRHQYRLVASINPLDV